jgi:phage antirepressor YoqD-like protein
LKTDSAKSYVDALSKLKNINLTDLVVVRYGGTQHGTWMHEDVALEFARWLSPEFAIWCNDRIKELMRHGMTALPETLEQMIANPDLVIALATQLKESRQKIAELQPKADFVAEVFEAKDLLSVGTVAKMLGTGQNRLFKELRGRRVLKYNNQPYQTFIDRGYFVCKCTKIGNAMYPRVVSQTYVTTRGLAWIRINITNTKSI